LLTTERSRFYLEQYLQGHDRQDPTVSPIRDKNPEQTPPTFVLTAGCDPTRDPALAYATQLEAAGVAVTTIDYPGWTHGFLFWGDEEGSLDAIARAGDALADALM
jgi:acetyl esterase